MSLDEGPPFVMGAVTWSGNTVVPDPVLRDLWGRRQSGVYEKSRIQRAQGAAYGEYAERGYLYVGIEPQETVRGDSVDVAFAVAEGRPSNVRMVHVAGNRGTREKVIRRDVRGATASSARRWCAARAT